MQLRFARLCLDCEEIHDRQHCPVCASESFAFITRWVPLPESKTHEPSRRSPEAAVYRRLLVADALRPKATRLLRQGAVGLAMLSLGRYVWRKTREQTRDQRQTGVWEEGDDLRD
jgi:hypothetical protein